MSYEAKLVADYARRFLPLANAHLPQEYYYKSLPLCVLDAVYSIGVKYSGTKAVVERYCNEYKLQKYRIDHTELPPKEDQESIIQFINKCESLGSDKMAGEIYCNRQRTSTRSGILKAEAVLLFAKGIRDHGGDFLQDVPILINNNRFHRAIKNIPGQSSGISLQYFWMLSGSNDFVKPDRMVTRFLQSALGRAVTINEIQGLAVSACGLLNAEFKHLTPRLLDYEIWKYQSKKVAS